MSDDELKHWLIVAGLAAVAAYSFWYTFQAWRKNRVIEDTPTSRVRSAAQGYVELSGLGILPPGAKTKGPLSGIPCVWWRYRIEQRRRNNGGRLPVSDASEMPFLLDDGTGQCLIDPRGAEVFPGVTDVWYGPEEWPRGPPPPDPGGLLGWISRAFPRDNYRYIEHRLPLNRDVYAIGAFHSDGGAAGAVDSETAMAELLREWKKDQPALLARFDTNHDGILSQAEWERARTAARRQVIEAKAAAMPRPTVNVLSEPGDGRAFLLAGSDGESLARRFKARACAGVGGFVGSSAALTWMLTHV
jgi:hypothetical protein